MNAAHGPGSTGCEFPPPLIELLAGYLLAAPGRQPGADGLTVEDAVLAAYPSACAGGLVPNRDELVRRHPDQAVTVSTFFARCGPAGRG